MDLIHESHLFSSSPAHPSHHRTQLPPKAALDGAGQRPTFAGPKTTNPLKRSASAANLLTPPASPAKEKHRSKRGFTDSDDEDQDTETEGQETPEGQTGGRIRRTRQLTGGKARTGRPGQAVGSIIWSKGRSAARTVVKSEVSMTAPVRQQVDRMHLDSGGSPVTPSRPGAVADVMDVSPAPTIPRPTTPTPASRKVKSVKEKREGPIRDSPNNPFLGSSPRAPATKESLVEKPTVTYVFRGVKAVFRNPAYGVPEPKEGDPSTLPPHHPNFSPDLITAPKLLWSSAPPANSDDDDVSPNQKHKTRPRKLVSGSSRRSESNKRRRLADKDEDVFGGHKSPEAMVQ